MSRARRVAAAQIVPTRGDVDENLEKHFRLVRAAAEDRVQVLVFPELSLTGYELDLAASLAFTSADHRLAPLGELASSYQMTLIVGAPAHLESGFHITAFVISPDRSITPYTKRHLGAFPADANPGGVVPPPEPTVFVPGNHDPLIRFDGNTGAVAVCADTSHPSHPRNAARRGANTYFASMFFTPPELQQEVVKLRSHAATHCMCVVMANFGGPSGGLDSAGGSAIWSNAGELLTQLPGSGEGVAIAIEDDTGWRARTEVRVA